MTTIYNIAKMKEQKKNKEHVVEKMFGLELTTNEALNKYAGPEFKSEKLKKIERKLNKQVIGS
jgi:glucose-6-phosphate 1-dehydrogenase